MYVIVRTTDGKYVTRAGSRHSYSERLQEAQVYKTKQEAEEEVCIDNEVVESVADIMGGN